jgi:alkanesulfonate monooxygenase SsuD/methylene tetrahydromethanopterin reductase-like flavin-dependent oxidoreductase (luciferase family)
VHAVSVSFVLRDVHLSEYANRTAELTGRVEQAGLDGVVVGDHVSFRDGSGVDGLVQAAALLGAHPTLTVETGIYLLPLRHPVLIARQLATLATIAPGRFVFGVGVGGEDPHEFEVCGVDPSTRGLRTDEALTLLRRLLSGEPVTHHGSFFHVDEALIAPPVAAGIPILVGGRSDAAVARAALHGEGWIALWVSPRRYAEATAAIAQRAAQARRGSFAWRHAYQSWCFFAQGRQPARARAAAVLGRSYGLDFERFERYTPCGSAEEVAEALLPYVTAGCRRFNLVADASQLDGAVEDAGEVKRLLATAAAHAGIG